VEAQGVTRRNGPPPASRPVLEFLMFAESFALDFEIVLNLTLNLVLAPAGVGVSLLRDQRLLSESSYFLMGYSARGPSRCHRQAGPAWWLSRSAVLDIWPLFGLGSG
jgi:hypothetical protein